MSTPSCNPSDLLARYIAHWRLRPEGPPFYTAAGALQPVRWRSEPAMLKIALNDDEARGNRLMAWWNGGQAARVFGQHGAALLMERLGPPLTASMSIETDEQCCLTLCRTACGLHSQAAAPQAGLLPDLLPLADWCRDLLDAATTHDLAVRQAAALAATLLAETRDEVVLHGDLHHGNLLHVAAGGWLAIDPKGLWGERGFDYANLFCNPDYELVSAPGRFERLLVLVTESAQLERHRLLCWIASWAGLSSVWFGRDGGDGHCARFVLETSLRLLAGGTGR
jgi:streptomycin 6-kinase